jgi:hypothetical protein
MPLKSPYSSTTTGKMFAPCPKRLQLVKQQGGFGNEIGVTGDILYQLRQKRFFALKIRPRQAPEANL